MEAYAKTPHERNASGIMVDRGAEDHDPSLYTTSVFAQKLNGWGALSEEHLDFYQQEGYLAIENAFSAEEVNAASAGLLDLIMGKRPDFDGIMFEAGAASRLGELSPEERQDAVRKVMAFCEFDDRLKALVEHPRMLEVVERILGEPPVCFQEMALLKPPHLGREKPWHQDKAYFRYPIDTKVVGVWIALDEATVANGCMHLRPQGHRDGPILHFQRRDWQICDTAVMGKPCVAVPLKPGGLLLFDSLLPHGTPTNHSDKRRKALQYHYVGGSAEKKDEAYRMSIFGSEGKDVTC